MSSCHTTIYLNSEINDKAAKLDINKSQLFEEALQKEIERREGRINTQIDEDTADFYTKRYKEVKELSASQEKQYSIIYNNIIELKHQKLLREQEEANKQDEIRALQVKAFEEFKKEFEVAIHKFEGKPVTEINSFIRESCPSEYRPYFFKIAREISKEMKENTPVVQHWKDIKDKEVKK